MTFGCLFRRNPSSMEPLNPSMRRNAGSQAQCYFSCSIRLKERDPYNACVHGHSGPPDCETCICLFTDAIRQTPNHRPLKPIRHKHSYSRPCRSLPTRWPYCARVLSLQVTASQALRAAGHHDESGQGSTLTKRFRLEWYVCTSSSEQ